MGITSEVLYQLSYSGAWSILGRPALSGAVVHSGVTVESTSPSEGRSAPLLNHPNLNAK